MIQIAILNIYILIIIVIITNMRKKKDEIIIKKVTIKYKTTRTFFLNIFLGSNK